MSIKIDGHGRPGGHRERADGDIGSQPNLSAAAPSRCLAECCEEFSGCRHFASRNGRNGRRGVGCARRADREQSNPKTQCQAERKGKKAAESVASGAVNRAASRLATGQMLKSADEPRWIHPPISHSIVPRCVIVPIGSAYRSQGAQTPSRTPCTGQSKPSREQGLRGHVQRMPAAHSSPSRRPRGVLSAAPTTIDPWSQPYIAGTGQRHSPR